MIKLKNQYASESADSFSGIGRTAYIGKLSEASEIVNFRILADGSLEKREGYECIASLPSPADAAAASAEDPDTVYALADGVLYGINLTLKTVNRLCRVADAPGGASFFRLQNCLFLTTGNDIFRISAGYVTRVSGYVPLYGKAWSHEGGEIFENLNLICERVRINYVLTEKSYRLYTGLQIMKIDSLEVNGQKTKGAKADGKYILLPAAFEEGTVIDIFITLPSSGNVGEADELRGCCKTFAAGNGKDSTVLCYRPGSGTVFFSQYVSGEQLESSVSAYPDSSFLYFPLGRYMTSDIEGGIQSVCGNGRHILISGKSESRVFDGEEEKSILISIGANSPDSAVYYGNAVYTAGADCIYRFDFGSMQAEIISFPLDDLINYSFLRHAVLSCNKRTGEIYVSDPSDADGRQFVYNTGRKCWYMFDKIGAGIYFTTSDFRTGFFADSGVFLFSDKRNTDLTLGNTEVPVSARYVSLWSDLGREDTPKRIKRIKIAASGHGNIKAKLLFPALEAEETSFIDTADGEMQLYERSISTGRTRHVRLVLESESNLPTRIHGFALAAIK